MYIILNFYKYNNNILCTVNNIVSDNFTYKIIHLNMYITKSIFHQNRKMGVFTLRAKLLNS